MKQVIASGDVIEEHPDNQPDPKVLLMSRIREEPLYVSCAFDGRYAYIVTVHWYDPARWIDPLFEKRDSEIEIL
ncbi:MAG TPA: DUF4258 domain-containing protein [Bryobacteraceae bacterium]|nr:DUF4258 domain-containing protein [Bryobacteraceae bacterium]